MADTFKNVPGQSNPANRWFAITASPSPLAIMPRGILCAASGDITLVDEADVSLTITAVATGTILPLRPNKITAVTGSFYGLY